jgi:ATP-dependent RNA helicase DDX5/DBP2
VALVGRDVISVAKTGSGKTCGFLLPAFQRIIAEHMQAVRTPPQRTEKASTFDLMSAVSTPHYYFISIRRP